MADNSDGRKWGFLEEDGGLLVCPFHNGSFTLSFLHKLSVGRE